MITELSQQGTTMIGLSQKPSANNNISKQTQAQLFQQFQNYQTQSSNITSQKTIVNDRHNQKGQMNKNNQSSKILQATGSSSNNPIDCSDNNQTNPSNQNQNENEQTQQQLLQVQLALMTQECQQLISRLSCGSTLNNSIMSTSSILPPQQSPAQKSAKERLERQFLDICLEVERQQKELDGYKWKVKLAQKEIDYYTKQVKEKQEILSALKKHINIGIDNNI